MLNRHFYVSQLTRKMINFIGYSRMFLVESKHQTLFLKNVSVWIMLKFSSLYKICCFINPKLLIAQYLHCKCKRGEVVFISFIAHIMCL